MQYDYTYDSTDRLVASSITDATNHQRKALFEYNFDLNNNLSKFTTLSPSGHNKTEYTYGNDNLLTAVSLDNSKTLNFTYDGIGHLRKHTLDLQTPLSTAYTYHGIVDASENDTVYKSNLVRDDTVGTGNVTLDENGNYQIQNKDFAYRYHYDANDNIIRLYNTLESEDVPAEEYTYDSLGMLEEVQYNDRGIKVTYFYDECGNILSESYYDLSGNNPSVNRTINYSYYGDIGDLLTAYDGDTITYDEIGNPLQYRDGISFTWSNGRQLQSYTKDNNTINYTYDGSGMRLTKDDGNLHYTYLYEDGLLVQETIGDKILDYSYTSGGSVLSVRYRTSANDEGVYYYYALNSRGDVIGLYDEDGNLHAKYTYDAWGNPISVKDASGDDCGNDDIANIQSLRYRSYYYDADTGFYYLQSRYYDPVTHRFINADGLVSTGTGVLGYNMFDYCENNPIRYSDSSGNHLDDQFKWNKMQREKKDKEARREKDNQAKADYETLSKLRNIAQSPNNTVFYDDTRTYKLLDGIQYESNVSSGIILHYSDDMSVVFSKKGYSITQQMFLNGFTTLNGSYTWRSSSNTAGCQFNNFSVFCGMDQESNHLIGWDYSVEHENNIIGSSSGTLIVSNDTYNTIQTIAVVVGVGALVAPFAPEILAAVGSFASAGAAILVPLYSAI